MITVKDMLDHAIETDLSHLAHSIYWALTEGCVRPTDDSRLLKDVDFDEPAILRMKEDNVLGIGRIGLFVAATTGENWYAFFFAENVLEADRLHTDLFNRRPCRTTRADRLMPNLMAFADTGEEEGFYDHRKKIAAFPAYIGHVHAGERIVHRVEVRR